MSSVGVRAAMGISTPLEQSQVIQQELQQELQQTTDLITQQYVQQTGTNSNEYICTNVTLSKQTGSDSNEYICTNITLSKHTSMNLMSTYVPM